MKPLLGGLALALVAGLAWLLDATRAPSARSGEDPVPLARRVEAAARPELAPAPRTRREELGAGADPPAAFLTADRRALASVVARVTTPTGERVERGALVLRHGARVADREELDAGGRARFAGLAPGRYSLALDADSLPPGLLAAPCPRTGSTRVSFTLEADRNREVPLVAELAATVRGLALDPAGTGVAGALVRLQPTDTTRGLASLSAQCDERGAFELQGVYPSSYRLHVSWPDGAGGAAPVPEVLALEPGSVLSLFLHGDPEPRSIRGRLVDEEGRPLPGLTVLCELVEADVATAPTRAARSAHAGPLPPAPWSRVLSRARTDEDGRYRLDGLPRAEVRLRAAPRVGSSAGLAGRRSAFEELLAGRFDLGTADPSVDAGTSVMRVAR